MPRKEYENGEDRAAMETARAVRKAIEQRWPVDDDQRRDIITDLVEMAKNTNDQKIKTYIYRTIMAADRMNQRDEHKAIPDRHELTVVSAEQKRANAVAAIHAELAKRERPGYGEVVGGNHHSGANGNGRSGADESA